MKKPWTADDDLLSKQTLAPEGLAPQYVITLYEGGWITANLIAGEQNGVVTYDDALNVVQEVAAQPMNATLLNLFQVAVEIINTPGAETASPYVTQMLDNIALGNLANATWNGGSNTAVALGNLSATSTQAQFEELIGKWFLGTDMPGDAYAPGMGPLLSMSYKDYSSVPLFAAGGPSYTDVNQGQVNDCWFDSALASVALQDPSLIEQIIKPNGNGTYSVEFQVNGKPTWETVNTQLPTYTTQPQYDGSHLAANNGSGSLWAELIEKGAAQLSAQAATGMQYLGLNNQYYALDGGLGEGLSLLTGQNVSDISLYPLADPKLATTLQGVQNALFDGSGNRLPNEAILTTSAQAATNPLIALHAYALTNVTMNSLYPNEEALGLDNPWGVNGTDAGYSQFFSTFATTLVNDHASIFVASGPTTVV